MPQIIASGIFSHSATMQGIVRDSPEFGEYRIRGVERGAAAGRLYHSLHCCNDGTEFECYWKNRNLLRDAAGRDRILRQAGCRSPRSIHCILRTRREACRLGLL